MTDATTQLLKAAAKSRQYILLQIFDGRDGKISPRLMAIAQRDLDALDSAITAVEGNRS